MAFTYGDANVEIFFFDLKYFVKKQSKYFRNRMVSFNFETYWLHKFNT